MTLLKVTTSCDSEGAANVLAAKIIDDRLAACAQITPITSHYIWENKHQKAQEFQLSFKTLPYVRADIEQVIKAAHNYDVPEIIFETLTASAGYTKWVSESVKAKP